MIRVFPKTVFALALTSFASAPCLQAQETTVGQQNTAKADEKKNDFEELRKVVQTGTFEEARKAIQSAAEANPDDMRITQLRTSVVLRLLNEGKVDDAVSEAEVLFQTQLARAKDADSLRNLSATSTMIRSVLMQANRNEKFLELIDQAIARARELSEGSKTTEFMIPVSQLISTKAQTLAAMKQTKEANDLLNAQLESLKESLQSPATQDDAALASSNLMKNRISIAMQTSTGDVDALTGELDALVRGAVEKNNQSVPLMQEFLMVRGSEISRIHRDEPEAAEKLLQDTLVTVEASELKKVPAITTQVERIKRLEQQIAVARLLKEMIGKPAPEFDIAAWAHGSGLTAEQMKGKVILLDFWAVWCGPCIATFPHLNEWYDEFHGQGFEIIGVTRQYGYTWDEEAGRASRAKAGEEVTLDGELAMLEKFMKHHELRHASIVTPKEADMNKRYGVTGIPHAVLIDRKGNIRMIKVGSSEANAEALHGMIRQLLAE
ncbi:MAG: TlpA disulfide reductase family protein [Planctomycetaceae bacterium]